MSKEALFHGQLEAVLSEFERSINTYDTIIETAQRTQEDALQLISDDPEIDWKQKSKLDQTIKGSHYRLLTAQKQKDELLIKMGQFAKNTDKYDAEEAVELLINIFLMVSSETLSDRQQTKLVKAIKLNVMGKSIAELKEFVTKNE